MDWIMKNLWFIWLNQCKKFYKINQEQQEIINKQQQQINELIQKVDFLMSK